MKPASRRVLGRVPHPSDLWRSLWAALLVFGAVSASGQGVGETDPPARAEHARAQAVAIEAREALPAAEREAAAGLARAAADAWVLAADARDEAKAQAEFVATAPGRIATARAAAEALADGGGRAPRGIGPFDEPASADVALREAEGALSRARAAAGEAAAEQATANGRLSTLGEELERARAAERAALDAAEPLATPDEDTTLLRPLRDDLTEARRAAARQQVLALEQLELALPMRADLAAAERRLAELRSDAAQTRVDAVRTRVAALRRAEARAAENAAAAGVDAARALPGRFPQWAERSVELARLAGDAAAEQSRLRSAATNSASVAAELAQSLTLAEERVEAGEMTEAVSKLFTAERLSLPSEARLALTLEARQEELSELSTRSIDLKDERRRVTRDGPTQLAVVPAGLKGVANGVLDQLTARLDDAQTASAGVLDAASAAVDADDRQLKALRAYRAFLDARLLWTPDLKALRPGDGPAAVRDVTHWLTQLDSGQVMSGLGSGVRRTPVPVVLLLIVGVVLLGLRRRLERAVHAWHEPVGRLAADRFGYTVKAFAAAVLIACTLPIILLAVGLSLRSATDAALVRAAGSALTALAVVLVPLLILRRIARPGGLAVKHFEWPENACLALRRALRWLTPLLAGTSLVVTFIGAEPGGDAVDLRGAGRLILIATMLTVSVFLGRLLRRRGPLAEAIVGSGGAIGRVHWLWYVLVVAAPVAVAALAAWGYYYTALRLESRLLATVLLGTALLIVYSLALRWLRLTHRRLSYNELLRKREAARQAREEARAKALAAAQSAAESGEEPAADDPVSETPAPADVEEHITPFALNEQTGKLISSAAVAALAVGLWAVWRDVLPALGILNTIPIPGLNQQVLGLDGVSTLEAVSLGALVLSIILLSLTFTAARHLPGLIDLVVLGRFGLQSGTRHAVTLLLQYVVVGIGLSLAFSAIGFGWSRIQWLLAALSVGLGFGLQEIFANFVSGLIILFERPIRLGDTVTVADTTGVVTKIRIRATTITDLNQLELIVPNKEFITSSLVNWSLSSPVTRLIVPVGIAYGADTRLAQKLLLEIAAKNKSVLASPPPSALFLGFGDNSLNFELRVFITDVLRRFPIKSELHLAIDDAFRKAQISIAFPQRDVHLDQLGPLEIRIADPSVPAPRPPAASA